MKKATLVLTLVLGTLVSNAQLSVSSTSDRGTIGETRGVTLSYKAEKGNDTLYIITFKNEKYTTLSDFKSLNYYSGIKTKDVTNQLYSLLLSIFDKDDKFKQEITLGEDKIILAKINTDTIWVWSTKGYFSLNKQSLKTIFNK